MDGTPAGKGGSFAGTLACVWELRFERCVCNRANFGSCQVQLCLLMPVPGGAALWGHSHISQPRADAAAAASFLGCQHGKAWAQRPGCIRQMDTSACKGWGHRAEGRKHAFGTAATCACASGKPHRVQPPQPTSQNPDATPAPRKRNEVCSNGTVLKLQSARDTKPRLPSTSLLTWPFRQLLI